MPARETVFPALPFSVGGGALVASPFQFLLTGEDNLRVACTNVVAGLTLVIQGRFLESGQKTVQSFRYEFIPTSTGVDSRADFKLAAGVLLNVVVIAVGAQAIRGQCFVRLDLVRGFTGARQVLGTLLSGYVGSWGGLAWPGTPLQSPQEGPGWVHRVDGVNPAAGAQASITIPRDTRWRVISAVTELTTSAVAGNRIATLEVYQSNGMIGRFPSTFTQTAAQAIIYTWAQGANNVVSGVVVAPLPVGLHVTAEVFDFLTLSTATLGMLGGDDYVGLQALVEEWRNPATTLAD